MPDAPLHAIRTRATMPPWIRPVLFLLFLSLVHPARAQDIMGQVRQWMQEHAEEWDLDGTEATMWEVTDTHTDKDGITYLYLRQTVHDLPVEGGVANFALRNGRVVGSGNRLQPDLLRRVAAPVPALDVRAALRKAAAAVGLIPRDIRVQERRSKYDLLLTPSAISTHPIPARLIYQAGSPEASTVPLAWEFGIREHGGQHWWRVVVDAHGGEVLRTDDRVVHCTVPSFTGSTGTPLWHDLLRPSAPTPLAAPPPPDGASYRVFALPTESPAHGGRVTVNDPADPDASPYGWHDTNGSPGAEYTITRGNNVYVAEDRNDNDLMGYSPDGGVALAFDFTFDGERHWVNNTDAALTNLFHTCNVLHDVWYHYGFDEASGNFQQTNYTGHGYGGDAVRAQAQDGGGMNNANFTTSPDGAPGVMQTYIWRIGGNDTLVVHSPPNVAYGFVVVTAAFGPLFPEEGITGDLVLVEDDTSPTSNGCETILNGDAIAGNIGVVDRGGCSFVEQVQALEAVGAAAVVVVNNVASTPVVMNGEGGEDIGIPAVMITIGNGQMLKNAIAQGPVNATLKGPGASGLRDGSLDNGVIAHEYGHGISTRLTGGAQSVHCLGNAEQMGEGWSDWMALVLTMRAGDPLEMPRGMGTYAIGQEADGQGIRPAPYTPDMNVNAYTYGDSNSSEFHETHAMGALWATMLWDLTCALVEEEGFDPDAYQGTGGNNVAMDLVMRGLKLQPCSPGFVDGRDAILLADELLYDGAHKCLLWKVFARRGLGYSASQGDPNNWNDQVEAFDLPAACVVGIVEHNDQVDGAFRLIPNPASQHVAIGLTGHLKSGVTVRLLHADGRLVHELTFRGGEDPLLDLHGLATGLYVVELEVEGERMHQRLVVE